MELVAELRFYDAIRHGRWKGTLPDTSALALSPWRRGYMAVRFDGTNDNLIELRSDVETRKKVIAKVVERDYSLISARELKLIDAMTTKDSPKTARLLIAKYRALGLLGHIILTEGIPSNLMPRKPRFIQLTPTPPDKLITPPGRLKVRGGRGIFTPLYVVPLFDRVSSTFGFAHCWDNQRWIRCEFAPSYVVVRTGSAKPKFGIYWTRGDTDYEMTLVCTTTREDKILGIIQEHFAKSLLEPSLFSSVISDRFVKVLAEKFTNDELIEEIYRHRADLRRDAHFKFDGKELELVLKLMGKKNEQNY